MTEREQFEAWWGCKYVSHSIEEDAAWEAWQAARAAPAITAEQKPVAWRMKIENGWHFVDKQPDNACADLFAALYAAPVPPITAEQEEMIAMLQSCLDYYKRLKAYLDKI
jgi:hypothetical protein